jgi:hypothetical protein
MWRLLCWKVRLVGVSAVFSGLASSWCALWGVPCRLRYYGRRCVVTGYLSICSIILEVPACESYRRIAQFCFGVFFVVYISCGVSASVCRRCDEVYVECFDFSLNILLVPGFWKMPNLLMLWLQLPDCSVVKLESGTVGEILTTVRPVHTVFMRFVFVWEQTATYATHIKNWLVFITEMKSVYSAVRTGPLNEAVCAPSFEG